VKYRGLKGKKEAILLFGNPLDKEREKDPIYVSLVIFEKRKVGEAKSIQVSLRGHIVKGVLNHCLVLPPGEVGHICKGAPSGEGLYQLQQGNLPFPSDDGIYPWKLLHDLAVKKTGSKATQEQKNI